MFFLITIKISLLTDLTEKLRNYMQNRSRLLVLNIGERIRFYDVATIVRTLLLAVFFCNDRILPARCLRHIQSVFNLIVDNDPYGHPCLMVN